MKNSISYHLVWISVMIFMFLVVSQTQGFDCQQQEYHQFLTKWKRNPEQELKNQQYKIQFQTFCNNKKMISEWNNRNQAYTLKQSRWMDKTQEQFNNKFKRLGISPVQNDNIPAIKQSEMPKKLGSSPSNIDYRGQGKVSSIKDQGLCGCCWAFATLGTYESFMMYKAIPQYDLSQQYILQCTTPYTKNKLNSFLQSSCDGGYLSPPMLMIKNVGAPLQSQYPYIAQNYTGYQYPHTLNGICDGRANKVYGDNPAITYVYSYRNLSDTAMRQLIMEGPIAAAFYAPYSFTYYSTGVFTGCSNSFEESYSQLNHAVVIVGYDEKGNYIIKNSWGQYWGDNGFAIIDKDRDCGISAQLYQYSTNKNVKNVDNIVKEMSEQWINSKFLVIGFGLLFFAVFI